MKRNKVYLIGTGPGDPELLTIKAQRLIGRADVILYDHLIPLEVLDHAKADAELICVGKFAGEHTLPQDKINDLMVERANAGYAVVRLKGGDPYLFGRGGEEAAQCKDDGVDFEVVPGITSPLGSACYAGIPLTHRDFSSSVAFITGHRKKGDDRPIEIPKADTLVLMMSVRNIAGLIPSIIDAGYDENTPIAAVEHGTCYDQRVVKGTLSDFAEVIEKTPLRMPAIFIVGGVGQLSGKLGWFAREPKILMLGTHPEKYQHLGVIIHKQIIDIEPLDDYSSAEKMIEGVERYEWIVFTSTNGVRHFFKLADEKGLDARSFANVKFAVIGRTTAETLAEFGISADIVPDLQASQGLLEGFAKLDMAGKKVLLPQAEVSSAELPDGLEEMGAKVDKVAMYRTVEIDPGEVDFDYIDKVLFTSGSTVRAFVNKFGELPENVRGICLGRPTQQVAEQFGMDIEIIPERQRR
ncbi:uroporphyrinogen-III C-methyltransferase [Anaerohalosphaera lusitana]|nr:uroporphyrinogen-III C-methyltransferase [Anaerohalosphaera lusitana]